MHNSDIRNNAPSCPDCGANVLRPKCLFDLNPNDCPRHELAKEYLAKVREHNQEQPTGRGK